MSTSTDRSAKIIERAKEDPNYVESGVTPDGGTWARFDLGTEIDFRVEDAQGSVRYVIIPKGFEDAIGASLTSAVKP